MYCRRIEYIQANIVVLYGWIHYLDAVRVFEIDTSGIIPVHNIFDPVPHRISYVYAFLVVWWKNIAEIIAMGIGNVDTVITVVRCNIAYLSIIAVYYIQAVSQSSPVDKYIPGIRPN